MFGAGHDGRLFTGVTGGHGAVGAATGRFDQLSNKIFFFVCLFFLSVQHRRSGWMLLAVLKENRECRLYLLKRNSDQACYSNNFFIFFLA